MAVTLPEGKKPWQSRTLVLNGVVGLCAAVGLFLPGALSISDWIAANGASVTLVWSLANMVLRVVTKEKVTLID